MITERFLNTYHNASTTPSPDVPADLASSMLAADPVLAAAAELARYSLGLIRERPRTLQGRRRAVVGPVRIGIIGMQDRSYVRPRSWRDKDDLGDVL
jgi:hypothetical protein